jgi:hypothetical protein
MCEETLRRFFVGEVCPAELAADVAGSTKRVTNLVSWQKIEDMNALFAVTRPMLIALCDAALSGELPPEALHEIGFALAASDHFFWDADNDALVAEVVNDWSCPEVNFPLTIDNVHRFKAWLKDEEPYPPKTGVSQIRNATLISVRAKKSGKNNQSSNHRS